jgi:3-carboxy-cis,cis-muconate cycloisomerase
MAERLLSALTGDTEVEALFSDAAEVSAMVAFERALAEAEAEMGLIAPEAAAAIAATCETFAPDEADLAAGLARDGVLGPAFVAQLRAAVAPEHRAVVHKGATSQDVSDTALTLRLKALCDLLDARLESLAAALAKLTLEQGAVPVMAHTRMQAALPVTAADKIATWRRPLARHRARLAEIRPRLLVVQLGGPVGTRAELGANADAIAASLARRLNLGVADPWHSARDVLVEFGNLLALIAGSLGKIGADVALLAQSELGAIKLAGGGTSSAMAHKSNPVAAEVLVALARHAAGLAGTLNQTLVHENERSGAAWTLEWLTLPPLAISTGAALRLAEGLVADICFIDRTGG